MIETGALLEEGDAYPLGASFDGEGVNVAVFSEHAARIELCLFDSSGTVETNRYDMPARTDGVWHGYLPGARPGLVYGFRADGPWAPEDGQRFNPAKLLLDPYAKQLAGFYRYSRLHYGQTVWHERDDRDNAASMWKACVPVPWDNRHRPARPKIPWSRTVIYEAHVKGLTALHPAIDPQIRGTFKALAQAPVLDHLTALGVTSLELLPIQAFVTEPRLEAIGLKNYWGYNTLGFFAPHPAYGDMAEFRAMVDEAHKRGLELILDVVYNHTCEGEPDHLHLAFKGLDNRNYYKPIPGQPALYENVTGCGNSLDLSHPRVLQLVMDSLRYWVEVGGVDGFRFDLAPTLAREPHGFDANGGFLRAVRQDPVLNTVKLIAEPWDIGPGGYQLGQFGSGWAEWNDRCRDDVRAFWRGDPGHAEAILERLRGSPNIFERAGRPSWASVNFVACHDGFALHDVVSYAIKHNGANGEGNRDGHNHNLSDSYGSEGPSDEPQVITLREQQKRNMLATVFLSIGTPMLGMGDEIGRTQGGNNNAYCQDNEISWLDWSAIGQRGRELSKFVSGLTKFRQALLAMRTFRWMDLDVIEMDDRALLVRILRNDRPPLHLCFNANSHEFATTLSGNFEVLLATEEPIALLPNVVLAARSIAVLEKNVK